MAKKKTKHVKMLSPEGYIKKRSRTLPIYKCWVLAGWEESKMTQVIVARQHSTGNITLGFYLVDLFCLGVKGAHYKFNMPSFECEEMIEELNEDLDLVEVSYELAHNIIFASLEFAEDCGLKPHKDFTKTMIHFLEDDDDVELIEIECGEDGKPVYVRGEFDSDSYANRVLAQLEKTLGAGNFSYVSNADVLDSFEEIGVNPYGDLSLAMKLKKFNKIFGGNLGKDDFTSESLSLIDAIVDDVVDKKYLDELFSQIDDTMMSITISDKLSSEMFANNNLSLQEQNNIFDSLFPLLNEGSVEFSKELEFLKKENPLSPVIAYLDVLHLKDKKSSKYISALNKSATLFPEFPLLKQQKLIEDLMVLSPDSIPERMSFRQIVDLFFSGRKTVFFEEMDNLIDYCIIYSSFSNDLELMTATGNIFDYLDFDDAMQLPYDRSIFMNQFVYCSKLSKEKG